MTEDKGILIKNIYWMLAYAYQELQGEGYAHIKDEKFEHVHDLLAEILYVGVSSLLKHGLYREYVNRDEVQTTVRGRIDIGETMRCRAKGNNHVACNYDDLSEDNICNRIIVTTLMLMIRHTDVKEKTKNRLKKLVPFFHDVSTVGVKSIGWNNIHYDKSNSRYLILMNICQFIIDGLLMTTEDGRYCIREFSDKYMCRLFEKFVLAFYKRHFPWLNPKARQIEWCLEDFSFDGEDLLPVMQTDITLTGNRRTLIIDTKYYGESLQSRFGRHTLHSGNLYQIHTYVTEADVEREGNVDGMLLYAKTQEEKVPNGQIKLRSGSTIFFRSLNLNQEFALIKKQLDSFPAAAGLAAKGGERH